MESSEVEGNGALSRGIKHAESGAHHTIDRAAGAAGPAVERIASSAHRAVDGVADAASHASDTLSATGKEVKEAPARLMDASRTFLRDHPVASLGIAVGAGFLINSLLRSR